MDRRVAGGNDARMLIGVAGLNSAGKGEVVSYLVERSFYALSLSDVIRQELADRGIEESRERMIETGTALRAEGGPAVLGLAHQPALLQTTGQCHS